MIRCAAFAQRVALPSNDEADWVPPAVERTLQLIDSTGAHTILSTSPPLATHIVAWRVHRLRKVRWIADFRDPLAGNPFRRTDWFFNWDRFAENQIFREADAFIANTDGLGQLWMKNHPERGADINIIWNGFAPEERLTAFPPSTRSRRVIAHVGTFYQGRHPGGLLTALDRLIRGGRLDPAGIVFEQTGWVDPSSIEPYREVADRLAQLGCYRASAERIPKDEADKRMAAADYLLLADLNEAGQSIQVPAKIFDYLCAERPVIAFTDSGSPTRRILEQSGVESLFSFPETPPAEFDASLLRFLDPGPRTSRPNAWFWETFDGERQTAKLARILRGERITESPYQRSPQAQVPATP
ncbi:MAG: hypothetical protein U0Q16_20270 [Bryobacteraceae bacterium]